MTSTESAPGTPPDVDPQIADPADQAGDAPPDPADDKGDKEAAKYRRQLRDTEAERDTLRTRLDTIQRAEVVRIADEELLAKPEAIWATGVELAAFLDADGNVDPAKVKTAAQEAVSTLGLAKRPRGPRPDKSQGVYNYGDGGSENPWGDLLKDRTRR